MTATTEATETKEVSTHVVAFSAIELAVREFEKRHKDVAHDCKTTEGDKAARKDRQEVQQHITSIETKRVELTEPHLTAQREIMAIATGFKARLTTLKTNYDTQIKAEETRKANVKRAEELEAQRVRDEAAAAERAEAERKAALLEAENAELRKKLAAVEAEKPVRVEQAIDESYVREPAYTFAPAGWDRIEPEDSFFSAPDVRRGEGGEPHTDPALKVARVPAAHDESLLDLLEAGSAPENMAVARDTRDVVPFKLPTAQQVADSLSDAAKKRTNIRHVTDVLEAIRTLIQD